MAFVNAHDCSRGPCENAAPGALRHLKRMTRSVTGCIPTRSEGTISVAPGAFHQPSSQASFAFTGTTTLGFLNTNTFPAITSTSPINAGAVHWYPSANAETFNATTGNSTVQ